MAKLRRDTHDSLPLPPLPKHLRIVASGTLFLTHTLTIPSHPSPSSVIRARSVEKTRGGSASTVLSLLSQFSGVEAVLVAPLGGNDEGRMVIRDLEREGVNTHFCKVWPNAGVPSAWVLHSEEGNTRTVINHNPLPDISHEEFVTLLGPILAPENYSQTSPTQSPTTLANSSSSSLVHATRSPQSTSPAPALFNPNSPAPFEWIHFEGRSVKTTLNNITGLDGLARERRWRSHCTFSLDVGRKGRQGIEAVIPYADVLFLSKQYAQSISPQYGASPRAFLLSLAGSVAPHALLVAYWGKEGAAVLSVPTREYFQSSGWVKEPSEAIVQNRRPSRQLDGQPSANELKSVRSGSAFWADGRSRTSTTVFAPGAHFLSEMNDESPGASVSYTYSSSAAPRRGDVKGKGKYVPEEEDIAEDDDSQGTEIPTNGNRVSEDSVDELGAYDAFVAGMIFALSRKLCPGPPYSPFSHGDYSERSPSESERVRWRLDECLRFATEFSGRVAGRRSWEGVADEMIRAGWFDN
ncbi:hypothetical protein AMATHDRAFT_73810 [Amanita thiersii Skay4041]|uniref:Carbohydrate kinase PfkB domain-containing protein n=1 Tax=Amanita thiersii Skay4041 TaxID=703135 RepID=A0A2A9NYF6_9AGAR|nr:hypothetical protein AMATHDRAFT_73810 [Amanita thiersii Skay4041]